MEAMEELMASSHNTSSSSSGMTSTLRPPPQQQQQQQQQGPLQCPRCKSSNTKFCYYNNYSLAQPRYFCKACRRYWTEGGSLRNVPVGGGSRKNKGSRSTSTTYTSTSAQNPKLHEGGREELNVAFPPNHFPRMQLDSTSSNHASTTTTPMPVQLVPTMPEYYRPNTFTFPMNGGGYGINSGGRRLMFPFEDSKDRVTDQSNDHEQNRGFWNGVV